MANLSHIPSIGSTAVIDGTKCIICGYKLIEERDRVDILLVFVTCPLGLVGTDSVFALKYDSAESFQEGFRDKASDNFAEVLGNITNSRLSLAALEEYFDYGDDERQAHASQPAELDSVGNDLLPIGSVIVGVGLISTPHMIVGYFPTIDDVYYDYFVVPYPQGMLELPLLGVANSSSIKSVLYEAPASAEDAGFLQGLKELAEIARKTRTSIAQIAEDYEQMHPGSIEKLLEHQIAAVEPIEYTLE